MMETRVLLSGVGAWSLIPICQPNIKYTSTIYNRLYTIYQCESIAQSRLGYKTIPVCNAVTMPSCLMFSSSCLRTYHRVMYYSNLSLSSRSSSSSVSLPKCRTSSSSCFHFLSNSPSISSSNSTLSLTSNPPLSSSA